MGKTFNFFLFHTLQCFSISSYPPRYIHSRFKKFMNNNISNGFIVPLIDSESYFQLIHSNFLNRPTATELQVAARIAKATDHRDMGTIDASSAVSTKRKQN